MKTETAIKELCIMLYSYDDSTGARGADSVIADPARWLQDELACKYQPFYAAAARMLVDLREKIDARSTSSGVLAAVKRIYRGVQHSARPDMAGIFQNDGFFCACDGYRLLRLTADIPSLPHVENEFDATAVMGRAPEYNQPVQLPTVAELKSWIAAESLRSGKTARLIYKLKYGEGKEILCNAHYLLDMLQALPGSTAKADSPIHPIYFSATNGDGILLPVRPKKESKKTA